MNGEQDFILLPGGVHLWGPRPFQLGSVPEDVVERHSAGYTLHLMESSGWKRLESAHVNISGDIPESALKVLAATAEEVLRMLEINVPGHLPKGKFHIRIFDKADDFRRYANACGASNALSLYDPRSKEMALHFGPR